MAFLLDPYTCVHCEDIVQYIENIRAHIFIYTYIYIYIIHICAHSYNIQQVCEKGFMVYVFKMRYRA